MWAADPLALLQLRKENQKLPVGQSEGKSRTEGVILAR